MSAPVGDLLRELAPQVLAVTLRRFSDFAAVEDAVQEALIVAARTWPENGLPDSPLAWLVQVANRKMIDSIRSEIARREREQTMAPEVVDVPAVDDSLDLFFRCCHPSLPPARARSR